MTNLIVCVVTPFSGTTTPDKNGKMPVMLQCLAGTMPNRNVLSGTVAQRLGVEVGHTYLMQVREVGHDDLFGRDFTFIKVAELETGEDILNTVNKLPDAEILLIERPKEFFEKYQRKGDSVKSLRSARIDEGVYHPFFRQRNEETAAEITRGTSLDNTNAPHPSELQGEAFGRPQARG